MAMFIETTFKSMFHKLLQPISIKEILILNLRWLQIKSNLLVFLRFITIKTVSIRIKGIISTKIEEPISIKTVEITSTKDKCINLTTSQPHSFSQAQPIQAPAPQMQGSTSKKPLIQPEEDLKVVHRRSNPKPSIPYPSRQNDEKRHENADEQKEKFYEIFKHMSFEISFIDALTLMPKFASTLKALIGNKENLSEMARTPLNEHCSSVILNKLPEKPGDPDRFLIPCKFPGMDECLALADLGTSINLMPFSVWKKHNLPNLTPTCMTLELADRSISRPIGIAEDVNVKVGVFQFPTDFVVVDFEPDPRVPLILERCFLKTIRTLIDVYEGELTLRVDNEAITYNLDQTLRIRR
ncbi:reverse transcriptase domain-containing protein [Tanacetum coccineum]